MFWFSFYHEELDFIRIYSVCFHFFFMQAKLVRDIKYVLRILILYIPLPLFWTLFDQQGSRWTLQAVRMDGYVVSILK